MSLSKIISTISLTSALSTSPEQAVNLADHAFIQPVANTEAQATPGRRPLIIDGQWVKDRVSENWPADGQVSIALADRELTRVHGPGFSFLGITIGESAPGKEIIGMIHGPLFANYVYPFVTNENAEFYLNGNDVEGEDFFYHSRVVKSQGMYALQITRTDLHADSKEGGVLDPKLAPALGLNPEVPHAIRGNDLWKVRLFGFFSELDPSAPPKIKIACLPEGILVLAKNGDEGRIVLLRRENGEEIFSGEAKLP